ncbi:biotin-dependent carboxyltransferase family protein [Aneurinibacillus thermoaerophilus]|uniref:5-oxoprolinase subunit C family protein n=1 Tax=Aneurinibacillus thermoaerophilus TaxID=143495 RepID=UPI002E1B0C05|nr:biotin-dependent carboxyltransferase family protein [Aneurinibacillus thermoaerophilus]MED0765125.1 biotin-dependent carboxyltransferase family protein [Aneurinibacillus thermoaerophilus]
MEGEGRMRIKVLRPGLLTTIQDLGRYGFQKQGIIASGAMDPFALRMANLLVGNEENAAALEITLMGPRLEFESDTLISICGADLSPEVDGKPILLWRPVYVRGGSVLAFRGCTSGCRAYLAVAGGFNVEKVLGSRSTYLRAHIGGYKGRALQEGDRLEFGEPSEWGAWQMRMLAAAGGRSADWTISSEVFPAYGKNPVVRVIRGAQFDCFTPESRQQFFASAFRVTPQSDRMGYRLQGPQLSLAAPLEMISEAVAPGTIQVPSEGQPIALLADRQTVGGYPKIAQIISVDLPVIAQVKPGEKIRFQEVSLEEAEMLYLTREEQIQQVKQGIALRYQ